MKCEGRREMGEGYNEIYNIQDSAWRMEGAELRGKNVGDIIKSLFASLLVWTYFYLVTYNFFISASDLLLYFDLINCNCAVVMRAPCAHTFGWGFLLLLFLLLFLLLLPQESKVNSRIFQILHLKEKKN